MLNRLSASMLCVGLAHQHLLRNAWPVSQLQSCLWAHMTSQLHKESKAGQHCIDGPSPQKPDAG